MRFGFLQARSLSRRERGRGEGLRSKRKARKPLRQELAAPTLDRPCPIGLARGDWDLALYHAIPASAASSASAMYAALSPAMVHDWALGSCEIGLVAGHEDHKVVDDRGCCDQPIGIAAGPQRRDAPIERDLVVAEDAIRDSRRSVSSHTVSARPQAVIALLHGDARDDLSEVIDAQIRASPDRPISANRPPPACGGALPRRRWYREEHQTAGSRSAPWPGGSRPRRNHRPGWACEEMVDQRRALAQERVVASAESTTAARRPLSVTTCGPSCRARWTSSLNRFLAS